MMNLRKSWYDEHIDELTLSGHEIMNCKFLSRRTAVVGKSNVDEGQELAGLEVALSTMPLKLA